MSTVTDHFDSSFSGIDFLQSYESSYSSPLFDTTAADTLVHIPGGNRIVHQIGGIKESLMSLPIVVDGAGLTALEAAVTNTATLVYRGGSVTATLRSVRDKKKVATQDLYRATLDFVRA